MAKKDGVLEFIGGLLGKGDVTETITEVIGDIVGESGGSPKTTAKRKPSTTKKKVAATHKKASASSGHSASAIERPARPQPKRKHTDRRF